MEKTAKVLEKRRKIIEKTLEVLLEYDDFLLCNGGGLYTPERRQQMGRDITNAREELVFLGKQQKIAEAERRRKQEADAYDSILKNTRELWRSDCGNTTCF